MKRIIDQLKYNFRKDNNGLIQLILINVVVFVVLAVIYVISKVTGNATAFILINYLTNVPTTWSGFIHKPWTLITYSFIHSIPNIFHILFNMLALYWFGSLIQEYIGSRRLINLYILGAIVGGLIFLVLSNHIPFFAQRALPLAGASGSVFAIAVAAATLVPEYSFYMLFIGPVRIVYIVGIYVFISFIGSVGENPGGDICHLGGALLGYLYIIALRNGTDLGQPINWIASKINRLKNPKLKVSYRKKENDQISQKEIDAILDKINRTGYSSLTKEEKQKLYKASQK
jgi:membrane associated rhomboid family serine protease